MKNENTFFKKKKKKKDLFEEAFSLIFCFCFIIFFIIIFCSFSLSGRKEVPGKSFFGVFSFFV